MIVFEDITLITPNNEGFYLTGKLLPPTMELLAKKDIKRAFKSDTILTDSVVLNLLLKVCGTTRYFLQYILRSLQCGGNIMKITMKYFFYLLIAIFLLNKILVSLKSLWSFSDWQHMIQSVSRI